jgi:hypothetical protein
MPTATPFAESRSPRLRDLPELALARELPPLDQGSGREAIPTATRLTDERGRPLSIFAAHRHAKVENRDDWRHSEELEAAVRSWSSARS